MSPGQFLDLSDCHGGDNQLWNFTEAGLIINVQSGLCMDPNMGVVLGGMMAMAGGNFAIQNTCGASSCQTWTWDTIGQLRPNCNQQFGCLALPLFLNLSTWIYTIISNIGANPTTAVCITPWSQYSSIVNGSQALMWMPSSSSSTRYVPSGEMHFVATCFRYQPDNITPYLPYLLCTMHMFAILAELNSQLTVFWTCLLRRYFIQVHMTPKHLHHHLRILTYHYLHLRQHH